jgi:hypothetical protein
MNCDPSIWNRHCPHILKQFGVSVGTVSEYARRFQGYESPYNCSRILHIDFPDAYDSKAVE